MNTIKRRLLVSFSSNFIPVLYILAGVGCLTFHFTSRPSADFSQIHHLVRAAYLQQEFHNQEGEKAALEEVEKFLQAREDSPMSRYILDRFQSSGVDLPQYIEMRKSALNGKVSVPCEA
ncbi:MAG TPA: hypothetical protein VJK48_05290 [Chlamydiales bacterium]|nr:hypothetical protein [Chlamydiales bacterium]